MKQLPCRRGFEVVKTIAFYLPQYYPIPENDRWWGPGFTDWVNVKKAVPQFSGHYQPHVPSDLGYYDLRFADIREQQADLAREHGVSGFCYYYYWFSGTKLLHQPVESMLNSRKPDFPFCLSWANENWTRRWDGRDEEILIEQHHHPEDDERLAEDLMPFFQDPRYIKIDGKPLLLIYRTDLLPDARKTVETLRSAGRLHGFRDLCLARVESFGCSEENPEDSGFDLAVEFHPHFRYEGVPYRMLYGNRVYSYADLVAHVNRSRSPRYLRLPAVLVGWDNTARRNSGGVIFDGSSPGLYGEWLAKAVRQAERFSPEHQIVFINAWNEWAEGCHLEPDQKFGCDYLKKTAEIVQERGAACRILR